MRMQVTWLGLMLSGLVLSGCSSVASRVPIASVGGQSDVVRSRCAFRSS
jgi:uncharacterized protein YceK